MDALSALYEEIYAHYRARDPGLVPRKIVPGMLDSEVLLVGQALGGKTQRMSGLPYCLPPSENPQLSSGGRELDQFLQRFGYTIRPGGPGQYAYHTDLAHYFPGKKKTGSGDVPPSTAEVKHNRQWFEREFALLAPKVVIPLGRQPSEVFLSRYAGIEVKKLGDVLAAPIECRVLDRRVTVVPVNHPSGAFQHPSAKASYVRAAEIVAATLAQGKTP